ncbi:MAG TPA: DNA cytosine methyltransferase [Lacipirellulaceae bacterium]|nr:DNA cytosine methyltransferase [Lacipirellulaceae bacterium]
MAAAYVDAPVFNIASLCSGVGWLDEGVRAGLDLLGCRARPVVYVERDAYAAATLLARMDDETVEPAPVWCGDLRDFDARPFRGLVDVLTAGLPCQPYSVAGKRRGLADHRSYGDGDGPLPNFLRIVAECRPAVVFLENVPAWIRGGFFRPFGEELCGLGYTIETPLFVSAATVGASHRRGRAFVLAHAGGEGLAQWAGERRDDEPQCSPAERNRIDLFAPGPSDDQWRDILDANPHLAPAIESSVRVLADGRSLVVDESRADQLRCGGNGCVPLQAAAAFVELVRGVTAWPP